MYEEEEDAPRNFMYNLSHLPGRFQSYAAVHLGMAGHAAQIERDFDKYFGHHHVSASQGGSAAHLQHGLSHIASGGPNHTSLSLNTGFASRTSLDAGQLMQNPQPLATTPGIQATFARAAPPGPLQIPDNSSCMGTLGSPQSQSSPFTPGMGMGLMYRSSSSHHAPSPRHVGSPTLSFGDQASPMSTSSHYASPLHTPTYETSMAATLTRSRSGSHSDMAHMNRGPLMQHRLPSFDASQTAGPSAHAIAQTATVAQLAQDAALRAQNDMLQRRRDSKTKARQRSEGSIHESHSSLARLPVTGALGSASQTSLQHRRLSEQDVAYRKRPNPQQGRAGMFTPELPANIQELVCGRKQQLLPDQQSKYMYAMEPPEGAHVKFSHHGDQLSQPEAQSGVRADSSTPGEEISDAETPVMRATKSTAVNSSSNAGWIEMASNFERDATKTGDEKSFPQVHKDHHLNEQSLENNHSGDDDFSQYMMNGDMDFTYPTSLVDSSIGGVHDPFYDENAPYDMADNPFEFNMDEFINLPQSQPNDDDNIRIENN